MDLLKEDAADSGKIVWLRKKRPLLPSGIKGTIGLDMGSHSLKMVGLRRFMGRRSLVSAVITEYSQEGTAEGSREEALYDTLRGIDRKQNLFVSSVEGPAVAVQQIKMPFLPADKLHSSLIWEVKRYIPFEGEIVSDAQVLTVDKAKKEMDVLVAVAAKEEMDAHLRLLGKAEIVPEAVEIGTLSMMNALMETTEYIEGGETVIVLDIGGRATDLNIFGKRASFFHRYIPIAGNRFTEAIQNHLHLGYTEAEALKKEGQLSDIFSILRPPIDTLITEIRQSIFYYKRKTGIGAFERIILSGGSANLVGLSDYLSGETGLQTVISNPLKGLHIDEGTFPLSRLESLAPHLTLAVGLALRG